MKLFTTLSLLMVVCHGLDDTFEGYTVYKEDLREKVFPYSLTEVCGVQKFGQLFHVVIRDPYENKITEELPTIHGTENLKVVTCFNFRSCSYVVTYDSSTNYTHFSRDGVKRSFRLPIIYRSMIFDTIYEKLYMVTEKELYEVKLDKLESWWIDSYAKLGKTLAYEGVQKLLKNVTDVMIANDVIYFIKDKGIFGQSVGNRPLHFIKDSTLDEFNFILFPHKQED